jgi:tRNA (guanine-N7-)-methyltransferase
MPDESIEYELGVPIPGRILTQSQWAKTAVKRLPVVGLLDWQVIFGRTAPVVLDVGCGNGRFTLLSAVNRPDRDHFAIDVLPVVIRYATRRANQRGLQNARFAVKDAETFLRQYVKTSSISEIHLYHPQPYHDGRRAGRRILTPNLLADVHRLLVPGGLFVVQTDNPDYWTYMTRVIPALFEFRERREPWPDAPEGRTRREILARQRGLRIFRGEATRRDELAPEAVGTVAASLPVPAFRSRGPWCELDRSESRMQAHETENSLKST